MDVITPGRNEKEFRGNREVLLSWIHDNNGRKVAFGEPLNKSLPGIKCNVIEGLTMT